MLPTSGISRFPGISCSSLGYLMRNSGGHVGAIFVIDRYDGYIDRFSLVKSFKGRNGMG